MAICDIIKKFAACVQIPEICDCCKRFTSLMVMILLLQLLSVEREQSLEGTLQSELYLHPVGKICLSFFCGLLITDTVCAFYFLITLSDMCFSCTSHCTCLVLETLTSQFFTVIWFVEFLFRFTRWGQFRWISVHRVASCCCCLSWTRFDCVFISCTYNSDLQVLLLNYSWKHSEYVDHNHCLIWRGTHGC